MKLPIKVTVAVTLVEEMLTGIALGSLFDTTATDRAYALQIVLVETKSHLPVLQDELGMEGTASFVMHLQLLGLTMREQTQHHVLGNLTDVVVVLEDDEVTALPCAVRLFLAVVT